MEHRTLVGHLLITFLVACHSSEQPTSRPRKHARSNVVFPSVANETGHSLPVFPDDPVVAYVGRRKPLAPPTDQYGYPLCVKKSGDTFCEDVDAYPETEIRNAINYTKDEFEELFGEIPALSSRKFSDMEEDTVCPQVSRLFYPKAAVNENDQWAYVVNEVDYVQTVMAEICRGEDDQPCNYMSNLPFEVTSRCKQKFAYKRMLALHPNKKRTYTDAFKFPSCCVCYVKKPFIISRAKEIAVEDDIGQQREKSTRGQTRE